MSWTLLFIAGITEVIMAIAFKYADGWTRFWPSLIGIVTAIASMILLTLAVKHLPISTAYAIWTGIGAVGVTIISILFMSESASPVKILCIALIFVGIIGLKLVEG